MSCAETAECAPLTQNGRDFPPVHSPASGEMCVPTRSARARLSPVPSLRNSSIQSLGCLSGSSPLPAATCTPTAMLRTEQGHDFTHLGRKRLSKLLEESSLFFPICPLGKEVKFSNRPPSYLGQSMPELSDEHYRRGRTRKCSPFSS